MNKITVFNFQEVNKGVLKATVSVNLGNGLILHECKILDQEGGLRATPPQRPERLKGGTLVQHDFVEFEDPQVWPQIEPKILSYYRSQSSPSN